MGAPVGGDGFAGFSAAIVRGKTTKLFSLREKSRPPTERSGGAIEIGIAIGIDES